jgi:uncharacterized membrane protein YfcA
VLLHFGILSAAGGLAGAALQTVASNPALTLVFAVLLMFAGILNVSGYAARLRFGRRTAWAAGLASGFLGGLVGNQGGIRSAGLLGFGLDRREFVATATAIGLIIDGARMPVYFFTSRDDLISLGRSLTTGTAGVVLGTLLGTQMLGRRPEQWFGRVVGGLIFGLGVFMMFRFLN